MNAPGQVPAVEEDNYTLQGPGGLLRAARESAGVSLRDISAQLHLDERTVDSLERDDFDNLPAPTFVRGYLRGYARLLSVPVGPVLEAYDREGFRPPDLVADIAEEPDNNATDFPVTLVTWAVVLILVAMVIVWWNNNNPDFSDLRGPIASDPVSPADTDPISAGAVDSGEQPGTGSYTGPSQSSSGAADDTRQLASAPVSESTPLTELTAKPASTASVPLAVDDSAAASAGATNRTEEVLAQAQEVLTQSRQAIEASTALTPENASAQGGLQGTEAESAGSARVNSTSAAAQTGRADSAPPANPPATTGSDAGASDTQRTASGSGQVHLVLKFAAEAWVQVIDRDEKKLYYDLAKAGQTIDLRGQGPLRIILGRTRGVEVLLDGQPFDVTPYVTKGVARFSLP